MEDRPNAYAADPRSFCNEDRLLPVNIHESFNASHASMLAAEESSSNLITTWIAGNAFRVVSALRALIKGNR